MAYRKIIDAGAVREIEVIHSWKTTKRRGVGTGEAATVLKQEQNWRNSIRLLSWLINANFTRDDLFISLTYAKDVMLEVAQADLDRFIRAMQSICRKRHLPKLKYIAVTENAHNPNHRWHHHIVISLRLYDLYEIRDVWSVCGNVISSNMFGKDFEGLAHYITKETVANGKRKWRQSKGNLIHPTPRIEKCCKEDYEICAIRTPKGYTAVQDTGKVISQAGFLYKYRKFVRNGEIDLSTGGREPDG